jgi:PAS domain S-box-containing protein
MESWQPNNTDARLQRVERRLEAQYAVSRALSNSESLEDAVEVILQVIGQSLGWDFASLWITKSDPPALRCIQVWQTPGNPAPAFARATMETTLAPGVGLPGRVLSTGRAAWIPVLDEDPNFPRGPIAEREGLHAGVAFPVLAGDEVLGVIEVFSRERFEPSEEMLEPLSAIGLQLGGFLERRSAEETTVASEARLSAVFQSALDCIITMDARGDVVDFNPAAEQTFGYKRAYVIGKEMAELIIPPEFRDQHRRGLAHYLETGEGPFLGKRIEAIAVRAGGERFPVELAISDVGLTDELLFTGYIRDITDRKKAEEERVALLEGERNARTAAERASSRLWQLQHITDAALSHLSLDDLLNELLGRIAELLDIEIAMILLRSEGSEYLSVRAAIGLGGPRNQSGRVRIGQGVAGKVAATGTPLIIDALTSKNFALPALRRKGAKATLAVPLNADGRVIGVLQVASTTARRFTEDDSLLLELAAGRMAVAIEHARLYEQEHGIAGALQRSLLPQEVPVVPGIEVAVRYLPGGAGVEVGGDWFDVIDLSGGRVGLVIGDVAGRGLRAAIVMGQLRYAFRAYAIDGESPSGVLARVNRLFDHLERPGMATAIYAIFDADAGELTWSRAGHPPPLVRGVKETSFFEEGGSLPLGVDPNAIWPETTLRLEPGSTLLLYTDGLVEHRKQDIESGLERLRIATEFGPLDAEALCNHVLQEMFGDAETPDDAALLALRLVPYPEPLRIRLPARPTSVASLRHALRRWLEGAGVGEEDVFDITVACGEAVSNSIEHAYGLGEGDIEMEAVVLDGQVSISIRDYGQWRAERETDRGRGFGMMRELMDDVDVSPASYGTEVRLTRSLNR